MNQNQTDWKPAPDPSYASHRQFRRKIDAMIAAREVKP